MQDQIGTKGSHAKQNYGYSPTTSLKITDFVSRKLNTTQELSTDYVTSYLLLLFFFSEKIWKNLAFIRLQSINCLVHVSRPPQFRI